MKRKIFLSLLCAVLVAAVALSPLVFPSFALRKLGDVDGNGAVTSADARLALRASVQLEALTPEQELAANVDDDEVITSADARLILRASVQLETIPELYVGEPDEPASEPSSEPSSEPASEPASEPSSEPSSEPASEPSSEPSSEPASEPSSEPSSEPASEPSSEPAESFIPPAANNGYDILRAGTYYLAGKTTDDTGVTDLEIAKTNNSLYLCSDFGGTKIAVLTIGKKAYLVNPGKKYYLDLNNAVIEAEMKALGIDVSDFTNSSSFDFSVFPPLDLCTHCEELSDGQVKYIFEFPNGFINVTLKGEKLLSIENTRNGSAYRIDFTSVSATVPSEMRELTNLKKRSQTLFIASLV